MISEKECKFLRMMVQGFTTVVQDDTTLKLVDMGLAYWADSPLIGRFPAIGITDAGKQAIIDYETARKENIEAVYREMYK